jgi:hypothetical protein
LHRLESYATASAGLRIAQPATAPTGNGADLTRAPQRAVLIGMPVSLAPLRHHWCRMRVLETEIPGWSELADEAIGPGTAASQGIPVEPSP